MNTESLIKINDDLLKAIARELERKYQKGVMSVSELEKNTRMVESIKNNNHIKEKLSIIYKDDLEEYDEGLKNYNDLFAEKFINKFCTNEEIKRE